VARGAHAAAMRERGLRLAMPHRVVMVRPMVCESVGALDFGDDDVVLLATKSQDTTALLEQLAVACADGPAELPVFCLQNGVANERMVLRRFRRVYGVVVMLPAVLLQPGEIDAQGAPYSGLLDLGRYPSGTDELAAQVAADLSSSGFVSRATPDIMRWKHAKLLRNLGNSIEALVGHDLDDAAMGDVQWLDDQMRAEAVQCFDAADIDWTTDDEWVERRQNQVEHQPVEGRSRGGGSSWQSLVRGAGSIEADYLNGEVVLLGRQHGVPTPVNELLQRQANLAARRGLPAGHVRPVELRAMVS
jgi:2-dehydropantoate 2-reductase